ncbi:hypothetical protein Dimus_015308 [Dionaea muscipula]
MALTIGKLTLIIGGGLLGSVLAIEGRLPGFSDFVSGAFKIALKPIKQKDSGPSGSKTKDDSLMAQVNSLRKELQLLALSRPVTIVTSTTRGGRRYGVLIVIVVVGCGYVWWKGWKLPDLSFATRRSLSDATASIAKRLEQVYSSVSVTKRDLSSSVDQVDSGITDVAEQNDKITQEVTQLRGRVGSLDVNIRTFHEAVQTLETKIHSIQGNEEETNKKVLKLVCMVKNFESRRPAEQLQSPSSASRPALERAQSTPSRIASIRPVMVLEPPSPSTSTSTSTSTSDGSNEVQQRLKTAVLPAGLKDLEGIEDTTPVPGSPRITYGKSSSLGSLGWRMISSGAAVFSRTRTAS